MLDDVRQPGQYYSTLNRRKYCNFCKFVLPIVSKAKFFGIFFRLEGSRRREIYKRDFFLFFDFSLSGKLRSEICQMELFSLFLLIVL